MLCIIHLRPPKTKCSVERQPEMSLEERIAVARGERPASLVIRNVRIFHLTTGEVEQGDIAVDSEGVIAGIGGDYRGGREFDGHGLFAVPGFIDAHVHLESSMLLPREYEAQVLKHGVTTAVCDPHEMANVVGEDAFRFYFDAAERLTMALEVRLSSCVPATDLETSGARIGADRLLEWHRKYPKAALAELMNVPGVLFRDPEVLRKVKEFDYIDGHCPLLSGKDLCAYVSAGVKNCHESSILSEAKEKILRGMQVLIREGSAARNLDALIPLITLENSPFLAFCTDDRSPLDMEEFGHIDRMVSRAISGGAPVLAAYRVACWSAAQAMGFWDRGLVAPGRRADILLLSDLESCSIEEVFVKGVSLKELSYSEEDVEETGFLRGTVKCREVSAADFERHPTGIRPVIGVSDGSLVTDFLKLDASSGDVLPVSVVERHGRTGNISHGLVHGFGLTSGAIASSVGHDSHNICVVGTNAADMAVAVNALRESQGGFAVARDGEVTGLLPLPLAGLISDQRCDVLMSQLRDVRSAVRDLGCPLHEPFLQLAFIPLPVIPHLKLTDMGLVDVDKFQLLT